MAQLGKEYEFAQAIAQLQAQVRALSTTPVLLNASTGQDGGLGLATDINGLHAYNSNGVQVNTIQTSDGTLITYDVNGNPMCRFGVLLSNPGHYGGEIWDSVNSVWVQLVTGSSVSWAAISGKPSTFAPSAHASSHGNAGGDRVTIDGSQVTSGAVPDASGSSYAYNNNVGGTSFFAVWVGNDAGNHLGKNVSSARYKRNIRRHRIDPARVLALKPVFYERKASPGYHEYGLIAEQVAETLPELVQWFNGDIEAVRYDLLSVALLEVVREQERRIAALERGEHPAPAPKPWHPAQTKSNNPPPYPSAPHPYQIEED